MQIRKAQKKDLPSIVAMLADDPLGSQRERYEAPLPTSYYRAFASIDKDPHQELMVLVADDEVIGTFQLSIIPYLTYFKYIFFANLLLLYPISSTSSI